MTNSFLLGRGARRQSFLAATFLVPLFLATSAGAAQFVLENPAADSFRSGVSVISGWACNATTVTIELIGAESTETIEANYGTPRGDTGVPAHCGTGDEDNGFGVLTNLNRLGTGPATAKLRLDGVVVATNIFTVTRPTDDNFNRDLGGAFTLPGFPGAGEAVDSIWTTSTQSFGIAPAGSSPATAAAASTACPSGFATKCNFENPGAYQFASGIFVFSGWACDVSESISLVIKGTAATETITPAYGTDRGDTEGACLDIDNGFGALSNVNRLGQGPATAELWIDGVLAVTNHFWVTKPSDENFNRDITGEFTLPGFPDPTKDTVLIWQSEDQNFSIKRIDSAAGPTPTPIPGSLPTPGITPTPSPIPTATPDGGPTPTPGDGPTPTPNDGPTPTPGPICGNGIIEDGEQCDGANLDGNTCTDIYGGFNLNGPDDCLTGSTLGCDDSCQFDGTLCVCVCLDDFDCSLPEGVLLDCGPLYCISSSEGGACDPLDVADCSCEIGDIGDVDGACLDSDDENDVHGQCIVTPFDPGEGDSNLDELCNGFNGGYIDEPRCDYCFDDF